MQALVKTRKGKGFIEVRDVPVPAYSPDEVLIKVKAAGICGTDIHIWQDKMLYWPPVIMGHEFAGEIVEVGENVKSWQKGDRVVAEPHTKSCGVCFFCRSGNIQICSNKRAIGWGIDGAFAEYIKMPVKLLHRIPDNVSYEEAALCEPLAIVIDCLILNTGIKAADTVVVEGAGPIGILSAMLAKAAGAAEVIITGTKKDEKLRFEVARELGFKTLNVEDKGWEEEILTLTQGRGADIVVEAAGVEASANAAIRIARRLGKIAILGITGEEKINFCWDEALFKALKLKFCFSSSYESWERALSLMSTGMIKVSHLITHRGNLTEWEKIFSDIENGNAIKGVFLFY